MNKASNIEICIPHSSMTRPDYSLREKGLSYVLESLPTCINHSSLIHQLYSKIFEKNNLVLTTNNTPTNFSSFISINNVLNPVRNAANIIDQIKYIQSLVELPITHREGPLNLSDGEKKRYKSIVREFEKEYNKYKHYIRTDASQAKNLFYFFARNLAKIDFEDCVIELTPSNSVKFKLLFSDKKTLIVTKPFGESDLAAKEIVFSLFDGRECLVSDVKNIFDLVKGINEYYNSK